MKLLTTDELQMLDSWLSYGEPVKQTEISRLLFTCMMYKKAYEDMQTIMRELEINSEKFLKGEINATRSEN